MAISADLGEVLEKVVTDCAVARGLGLGKLAQPLRAALAGRTATPSVFDMMLVLGRDETLARLADVEADSGAGSTGNTDP